MQPDASTQAHQDDGEFAYLRRELRRRAAEFPKRLSFIFFVLVAIAGLGGLGIWTELVKIALAQDPSGSDGLFTAATTFYPAVVASATFRLLLVATGNNDRVLTSFSVFVMVSSFVAAVLSTVFRAQCPVMSLTVAALFVIFSIWVWIVSNADDPIYKSVPVDAPSGGNPSRDPKGDLSEFKVD